MNRRLQQFLSAENISQSQFADEIGVARASVSHIIAGRNKPGFDFIESMARHYPALNVEWLVLGTGKMYKSSYESSQAPANELFSPLEPIIDTAEAVIPDTAAPAFEPIGTPLAQPVGNVLKGKAQQIKGQRNISRIIVFYDDNTYQELK